MTTINLKDFYPWYTQDEYTEISDEVAEELRANKRYEATYRRRVTRNKAQYSLDCDDGIEYSACVFEPSPEELVLRKERLEMLCHALNSLSEKQGRRVEARILDGKKLLFFHYICFFHFTPLLDTGHKVTSIGRFGI